MDFENNKIDTSKVNTPAKYAIENTERSLNAIETIDQFKDAVDKLQAQIDSTTKKNKETKKAIVQISNNLLELLGEIDTKSELKEQISKQLQNNINKYNEAGLTSNVYINKDKPISVDQQKSIQNLPDLPASDKNKIESNFAEDLEKSENMVDQQIQQQAIRAKTKLANLVINLLKDGDKRLDSIIQYDKINPKERFFDSLIQNGITAIGYNPVDLNGAIQIKNKQGGRMDIKLSPEEMGLNNREIAAMKAIDIATSKMYIPEKDKQLQALTAQLNGQKMSSFKNGVTSKSNGMF